MHPFSLFPRGLVTILFTSLLFSLTDAHSYFQITSPSQGTQLQNGAANKVTWVKGLLDDVNAFDVEMSRLSVDGLILVARDVPASQGTINLFLQDVPAADDYYLLFLNSTSGVMFTSSSKFAIGDSSSNATATSPDPEAPTVTISGGPDPLKNFVTTFPANANGVESGKMGWQGVRMQVLAAVVSVVMCVVGGVVTVL